MLQSLEEAAPLAASGPAPSSAQTLPASRLPRSVSAALAITILASAALLAIASLRSYLYVPYSDVHDWIGQVFAVEHTHDWLGYVWRPHTAQRIPLARLTELFDVDVARSRLPSFLLVSAVAWLIGCAGLAMLVARTPMSGRARGVIALLAGLLATQAGLGEDLAFPVFSVYLMVAGPALAAVAAFHLAPRHGVGSASFWAALAFAALACGGNAAGLAVWPVLLAAAVLQARGREQFWAVLACAVVCGLLIEAGLGVPSESFGRDGAPAGAHLLKIVLYFLQFLGLPWTRSVSTGPAAGLGLVVAAYAGVMLLHARPKRQDALAALETAGVALILFGLLTAALAALGRVDELPAPIVPTRYTPFATLLQLGLLLASVRILDSGRYSTWLIGGAAAVVAMGLVTADLRAARNLHRISERIATASRLFDATGRDSGGVVMDPSPALAMQVRRQLAARGLPH